MPPVCSSYLKQDMFKKNWLWSVRLAFTGVPGMAIAGAREAWKFVKV